MSFRKFFHRFGRPLIATLTTVATLAVGSVAWADGGGGHGGNSGKIPGSSHSVIKWRFADNLGAPTEGNVANIIKGLGASRGVDPRGVAPINQALSQAISECNRRHRAAGHHDAAQCRLAGVGVDYMSSGWYTGSDATPQSARTWFDKFAAITRGKTYRHNGAAYKTSDLFSDHRTSINSLVSREVSKANRTVVVIVLDKYEPPTGFKLVVTTKQQAGSITTGGTQPVHDLLHISASNGSYRGHQAGKVILHFDGNHYVPAAQVSKNITISRTGNITSPSFTPSDFGWKNPNRLGWQAGTYWFDVQIAKQGDMTSAVDTADRAASEKYSFPEQPPRRVNKTIDKGQSADEMVNRTKISASTGRGGYEMRFTDKITPNGVNYSVSNFKLIDKSSNNKDVASDFDIAWNKAANTVTATRKGSLKNSEMPLDHTLEFSFDVTVAKPDFSKVHDVPTVSWNQVPDVTGEGHEFPTWRPNPDKSWILQGADGKWQAVIDPSKTNKTGGDEHKFLDGDEVASVVNGTVGQDLVNAPTKFVLTDDWSKASYIFKASDVSKIRVYEADGTDDQHSSVADIANKGTDVTSQFDINVSGMTATATAKPAYLAGLKGLAEPRQVTLLVPGVISFANGKGAAQVRKDAGVKPGDELTFCKVPTTSNTGLDLSNTASETVNSQTVQTNIPRICGYIPPVRKDVVSEASQGGDQASVDGKVVYPGQKVEYQLLTTPRIPADLAYQVKKVVWTDSYDQYLVPDDQTLEMIDLNSGKSIPKNEYSTSWDEANRLFTLTVTSENLLGQWRDGANPRLQVRFEGTVSKDAPTDHKVGNEWTLTLNNSLTPSNEVVNVPPKFTPSKADHQSADQGDPTIDIDGKTMLLGDKGQYSITLDVAQTNTAYKVWRLGIVDDYDDTYLKADAKSVKVFDASGKDVTGKFNIQIQDGGLYVFAKTVDTFIPATGKTVKGDPQPSDLKAYSEKKHDPLHDPSIDQSLLGQKYQVILPYTVIKVKDGYVVKNTAIQVENDQRKVTNEVSNPLKVINPKKDVVINVGGDSANGKDIYLNHWFLYRLDSSILPVNRAYKPVSLWSIVDRIDTTHDEWSGNWIVQAATDLYQGDTLIARKGEKIAGTGFKANDAEQQLLASTGDKALFTATADRNGVVTVQATKAMLKIASDDSHEAGWTAYLQMRRVKTGEKIVNSFVEHINDKVLPSNTVWTRTPDQTPKLRIEKFDTKSGLKAGDRNKPQQALTVTGPTQITVRIWNEGKSDIHGLKLSDKTIAGDGTVTWDRASLKAMSSSTLKPGDHVDVTGTLNGVSKIHTDRATVTGVPILPCPVSQPDIDATKSEPVKMCDSTPIQTYDDWNGKAAPKPADLLPVLGNTGVNAIPIIIGIVVLLALGSAFTLTRVAKDHDKHVDVGRHTM